MTAEIAIMNKLAIALAADSAVTITKERGEKIYYTVDKLFCISKDHPIGLMIYGNAEFIGMPWETIIGSYTKSIISKKFSTLEEYGIELVKYIEKNKNLIGKDHEQYYFNDSLLNILISLKREINKEVEAETNKNKGITPEQINVISEKVITSKLSEWQKFENLKIATKKYTDSVRLKVKKELPKLIELVFEKFPLSTDSHEKIEELSSAVFCRNRFKQDCSGIVLAGFGESEYNPGVISYEFEGKLFGKAKYNILDKCCIGNEASAYVLPFAQTAMVHVFMEGIDPNLKKTMNNYSDLLIDTYPGIIMDYISQIPGVDTNILLSKLKKAGKELNQIIDKQIKSYKEKNHSGPITKAVSVMPKKELATMAESLVQLTSLKQRFSLQSETVGGPINVALISKVDGFVWVKKDNFIKV